MHVPSSFSPCFSRVANAELGNSWRLGSLGRARFGEGLEWAVMPQAPKASYFNIFFTVWRTDGIISRAHLVVSNLSFIIHLSSHTRHCETLRFCLCIHFQPMPVEISHKFHDLFWDQNLVLVLKWLGRVETNPDGWNLKCSLLIIRFHFPLLLNLSCYRYTV